MFIKVNLTSQNIKNAECCDAEQCVLAQKANRLLLKKYRAHVGGTYLKIVKNEDSLYPKEFCEIPLSGKNMNIVRKFDNNNLKPCETFLNIPKKFLKPSVTK